MKPLVYFPFPAESQASFWNAQTLDRLRQSYDLVEPIDHSAPWENIPESVSAVITGWGAPALMPAHAWGGLKNLKGMAVLGSSTVVIEDCGDAARRGIAIISAANAIAEGVAEETVGLILASQYELVSEAAKYRQAGELVVNHTHRSLSLAGAKVGLVGFGFVGQQVAQRLSSFGVELMIADPYTKQSVIDRHDAQRVELEHLLKTADIISVHAGWTPETEGMLSRDRLDLIRDGALLVSTARMPLFDQTALAEKVRKGKLRFASDFVPFDASIWSGQEISSCPNLIAVPGHTSITTRTLDQMGLIIADDLERLFTGGQPLNQVSAEWMQHTTILTPAASS